VGDVLRPAFATDEAIVRFDGTGGKQLQGPTVKICDTGVLSQGSASISLISDVIALATGNNKDISLNPNGTGIVTSTKNIRAPAGGQLQFGPSNARIVNNATNSVVTQASVGSITGAAFGTIKYFVTIPSIRSAPNKRQRFLVPVLVYPLEKYLMEVLRAR